MTPEAQRIAIAEACGFYNCRHDPILGWRGQHPENSGNRKPIPEYLNDLNAMHEAESKLAEERNLWVGYWFQLTHVVVDTSGADGMLAAVHATAKQRAEAFLRTIGKWVDD